MKYILLLVLAALLGSCAIAPAGHGHRERDYNPGNGTYLYHDYNDGYFLHYSCREAENCGDYVG